MINEDLDTDDKSTEEVIMEVTYHALCEYGYAGLSIQRIADSLDMSKSSIYYHYDSKDDLLLALLDYVTEYFVDELTNEVGSDAEENILTLIETLVPTDPDAEQLEGMVAMYELRSRAVLDEVYKQKFTEVDETVIELIESFLDQGASSGRFSVVDTRRVAEHIYGQLEGARMMLLTSNNKQTVEILKEEIRDELSSLH